MSSNVLVTIFVTRLTRYHSDLKHENFGDIRCSGRTRRAAQASTCLACGVRLPNLPSGDITDPSSQGDASCECRIVVLFHLFSTGFPSDTNEKIKKLKKLHSLETRLKTSMFVGLLCSSSMPNRQVRF